ncbi:MAG: hypothetical protein AAF654_10130 [Myxococcota bacterium]
MMPKVIVCISAVVLLAATGFCVGADARQRFLSSGAIESIVYINGPPYVEYTEYEVLTVRGRFSFRLDNIDACTPGSGEYGDQSRATIRLMDGFWGSNLDPRSDLNVVVSLADRLERYFDGLTPLEFSVGKKLPEDQEAAVAQVTLSRLLWGALTCFVGHHTPRSTR